MSTTVKPKKRKKKLSVEEMHLIKERQKQLYYKQRRKERQRKMQLYRIKFFVRMSVILFIFIGFIYLIFLPQWKLSPLVFSYYPNKNLLIKDNLMTKDNQILDKLKQIKMPDQPLFFFNTGIIEKKLMELDPVKKVIVRRYWLPARLSITVIEKEPVMLVYPHLGSEASYAVTKNATIISKKFLPLPQYFSKNLFVVINPDFKMKWTQDLVAKFDHVVKITEKSTQEKVEYVDITNPNDVYIKTTGLLLRVGDIDATSPERISRLSYIMPKINNIKNNIEYVNLQWDKALTIKEKSFNKPKNDNKEVKKSDLTPNATEQTLNSIPKKQKVNLNTNENYTDNTNHSQNANNEENNPID